MLSAFDADCDRLSDCDCDFMADPDAIAVALLLLDLLWLCDPNSLADRYRLALCDLDFCDHDRLKDCDALCDWLCDRDLLWLIDPNWLRLIALLPLCDRDLLWLCERHRLSRDQLIERLRDTL